MRFVERKRLRETPYEIQSLGPSTKLSNRTNCFTAQNRMDLSPTSSASQSYIRMQLKNKKATSQVNGLKVVYKQLEAMEKKNG